MNILVPVLKLRGSFNINLSIWGVTACIIALLTFTSCHTSKKIKSRPGHPEVEQIHVKKASGIRKKIVEEANKWIGTPYKYAAAERGVGTDCSGMVLKVYEKVTGEKLPRNSAKQAEYCIPLDSKDIQTGDLVFFATGKDPKKISHVGIVLDDVKFIHASSSKGVVISSLENNYFKRTFIMFGRTPGIKDVSSDSKEKNLKKVKKKRKRRK